MISPNETSPHQYPHVGWTNGNGLSRCRLCSAGFYRLAFLLLRHPRVATNFPRDSYIAYIHRNRHETSRSKTPNMGVSNQEFFTLSRRTAKSSERCFRVRPKKKKKKHTKTLWQNSAHCLGFRDDRPVLLPDLIRKHRKRKPHVTGKFEVIFANAPFLVSEKSDLSRIIAQTGESSTYDWSSRLESGTKWDQCFETKAAVIR